MSRKHYREIAAALLAVKDELDEPAYRRLVSSIAEQMKMDNSAFRFDRFYAAAGVTP